MLCVTHLPQVAALGHSHFTVSKQQTKTTTKTIITQVKGEARVTELARLLGGTTITEQARANAKSMLALVPEAELVT